MVQMAEAAKPTNVADLGALPRPAAGLSAAGTSGARPNLENSMSRSRQRSRMVETSLSGSGEGPGNSAEFPGLLDPATAARSPPWTPQRLMQSRAEQSREFS